MVPKSGSGAPAVILFLLAFASDGFAAKFLLTGPAEVVEGTYADFICESENKQPIEECRFTVPGFATQIKIFSGIKNEKYEFVGDGFPSGQCGLGLRSVNRKNAGSVKCSLILKDNTEQQSETNVTVLYPFEKLKLVSNSMDGTYEYKENNIMEFNCSAEGGFPPPTYLSLVLGGQLLNSTSQRNLFWSGPAKFIYNKQQLECRAEQISNVQSPSWTHNKSDTRQVLVEYAPQPLNKSDVPVMWISVYPGDEVNVTVKILANPKPFSVELSKDGNFLEVQSLINENLMQTVFEYTWTIPAVKQADFKSVWNLYVRNDIGSITVVVKLIELKTTTTRPTVMPLDAVISTTKPPDRSSLPSEINNTAKPAADCVQPSQQETCSCKGVGDILAFIFGFLLLFLLAAFIWYARKEKLLFFKETTRKQSELEEMSL